MPPDYGRCIAGGPRCIVCTDGCRMQLRALDLGQRYRLSPEAAAEVAVAVVYGGPNPAMPYLRLNADGVTLDPCPPAEQQTPDSPAQPAEHSQPDYAPADNPAGSAADPSTTPHPEATPNRSAPTKSSADTPAETPSTPATSEPRTGAATAEAAPTSPTASKQPDEQADPTSSMTTGDQPCGDQHGWAGHHNVCTLPPHPGDPWHQADPHPDWPDIPGTRWRHNTPADDRLDLAAITQQLEDGPTEATTDRIKWSPIITVSHEFITDATLTDQPSTTGEGGSDV